MRYFQLSFVFIFLFFFECTLHQLKINGNPAVRYNNQIQPDKKTFTLERNIPANINSGNLGQLIQSYNSDRLNHFIERDCCIKLDESSNYVLRYSTDITDDMPFPLSPFLFFFTLGLFPVVETADALVKFQIIERRTEKIVKEYHYRVTQKYATSWLSILVALFLRGDEWDLAMFNTHGYPQEMIVSQFHKDFISDIQLQKLYINTKTTNLKQSRTEHYAILPIRYSYPKDKDISEVIRDKVETVLVNKNYTVLERTKMNEIAKEFKLSQTGLTRSDQIELGKMLNASNLILTEFLELNKTDSRLEFSIKNIEIESGRIIWKYEFTIDETKTSESINKSMVELEKKIK